MVLAQGLMACDPSGPRSRAIALLNGPRMVSRRRWRRQARDRVAARSPLRICPREAPAGDWPLQAAGQCRTRQAPDGSISSCQGYCLRHDGSALRKERRRVFSEVPRGMVRPQYRRAVLTAPVDASLKNCWIPTAKAGSLWPPPNRRDLFSEADMVKPHALYAGTGVPALRSRLPTL